MRKQESKPKGKTVQKTAAKPVKKAAKQVVEKTAKAKRGRPAGTSAAKPVKKAAKQVVEKTTKAKRGRPAGTSAAKAAGKTAAKATKTVKQTRKTPDAKGQRAASIAELNKLLPKLSDEGIRFLVDQAHVHIYNMHVDEVNKFMITTGENEIKHTSGDFSLKVSSDRYYLSYKNESIIFNLQEMVQIARIAMSPIPMEERKAALYRWLEEERRDVLGILPGASQDIMEDFIGMINKTITLKYR